MNEIENYLSKVKNEIISLKGDITLIEEFRSSIIEELKDFKQEYPSIPEDELEKKFIASLEPPVEIARSLTGEIAKKRKSWLQQGFQRFFDYYNQKVISSFLGSIITYCLIWMIPGIIYLFGNFDLSKLVPVIFNNVPRVFYTAFNFLNGILLFKQISFTFYLIFDPFFEYRVLYTYPVVAVILYAFFILYQYRTTSSLLEIYLKTVISSFSFAATLFSVDILTVLARIQAVLPQFEPMIPRLFTGYAFLFGSLIFTGILIIFAMVIHDKLRSIPLRDDYFLLVNLVLDRKSAFFTALVIIIVSFSPLILTILDSPNVFNIYILAVILLLLVSFPVLVLIKTDLKYCIKVSACQVLILVPLWVSVSINFGIFISLVIFGALFYNLKIRETDETDR